MPGLPRVVAAFGVVSEKLASNPGLKSETWGTRLVARSQ